MSSAFFFALVGATITAQASCFEFRCTNHGRVAPLPRTEVPGDLFEVRCEAPSGASIERFSARRPVVYDCGSPNPHSHTRETATGCYGDRYVGTIDAPDETDWAHVVATAEDRSDLTRRRRWSRSWSSPRNA